MNGKKKAVTLREKGILGVRVIEQRGYDMETSPGQVVHREAYSSAVLVNQ